MLRSLAVLALLAAAPAGAATIYTLSTNLFDADPFTVTSFTYDGGTGVGTIVKLADSASDDLFLAALNGTIFTQWTLTAFDDSQPGPPQIGQFAFTNVTLSSFTTLQGSEEIVFNAEIPEPSSLSLLLLGGVPLLWRLRRRGDGRTRAIR